MHELYIEVQGLINPPSVRKVSFFVSPALNHPTPFNVIASVCHCVLHFSAFPSSCTLVPCTYSSFMYLPCHTPIKAHFIVTSQLIDIFEILKICHLPVDAVVIPSCMLYYFSSSISYSFSHSDVPTKDQLSFKPLLFYPRLSCIPLNLPQCDSLVSRLQGNYSCFSIIILLTYSVPLPLKNPGYALS